MPCKSMDGRWLAVLFITATLSDSYLNVEAFVPTMLRGESSMSRARSSVRPPLQRPRTGSYTPSIAGTCRRQLLIPIRASADQGDDNKLRRQFDDLLEKSGRDSGMKKLKAPKGSWASLRGDKSEEKAKQEVSEETGENAKETLVEENVAMKSKPNFPSYAQMDAYLKGRKPEEIESQVSAKETESPRLVRPSYSISKSAGSVDDAKTVAVKSFEEGDDVPLDLFSELVDIEGKGFDLSELESAGRKLLLMVPEPAHHSGASSDNWTKLLIDIQNKLGSHPPAVSCVAVSPEPSGVHTKMLNKYRLKLFSFLSDPERRLMRALKLWDPEAAGTGATLQRQTFVIDVLNRKFARILRQEPLLGHAEAVRDCLLTLGGMQDEVATATAEVLSGPPKRPLESQEPEEEEMEEKDVQETEDIQNDDLVASLSLDEAPVQQVLERPQRTEEEGPVQAIIEVEESLIGLIIGRKGATIRQLQDETGARIRIETAPGCRAVIAGTREQCKQAIEKIEAMTTNMQVVYLDIPANLARNRVNFTKLESVRERLGIDLRLEKGEQNENVRWIVRGRNINEEVKAEINSILETSSMQTVLVYEHGDDQLVIRSIVGIRGSFIKQLEEETGLILRTRSDESTLVVSANGPPEVIEQLRSRFTERISSMVEEVLPLSNDAINLLLANSGKYVRKVEEVCQALVSVEREPSLQLRVRGEKEEVKKAIGTVKMLLGMQESEMLLIPNNLCRMLVGPNSTNIEWLEKETGCYLIVKNKNREIYLQVSGNKQQRAAGVEIVKDLLFSDSSKFTTKMKLSSEIVAELLRRKGARMREIEADTGTYISAIKYGDDEGQEVEQERNFSAVLIRGPPSAIESACARIRDRMEQSVDELLLDDVLGKEVSVFEIRTLIGLKGQKISEIEKMTGATVRIEQEARPRLLISGTQEEKEQVLTIIRQRLSNAKKDFMPLEKSLHGTLIGVGGKVVRWIEERSGAQISFQTEKEEGMLVCGTQAERSAAIRLARDILENDRFEHFFLPSSGFGAILGPKGRYVQEIEVKSGARVHVLDDYNIMEMTRYGVDVEGILAQKRAEDMAIIMKGSNEQRRLAKELIESFLEASGVDIHTLNDQDFDSVSSVRGSFVVKVEEECSVMVKLNFKNSTIEIKGKAEDRQEAFERIQHYLSLEEEEILFETEFPVIMLRSFIGINGKNVKEVEKRTGCWVRVLSENRFHLILKGDAEARRKVVREVEEWRMNNQYERFPMAQGKHYAIIGKNGATIHQIEQESNTVICFSTTPEPAMVVFGREEDRKVALALAEKIVQGSHREQDVITVPRDLHALIIGLNGKSIKKVEQDSGARVQIKGSDEDNCIISGTEAQRSAAVEILMDLIRLHGMTKVPCEERLHRVVIGPRGSTVSWIEKRTTTVISFLGGAEPCVVIKGAEKDRAQAVALVEEVEFGVGKTLR
eukprot:763664-Hanusia_phi.AAC.6